MAKGDGSFVPLPAEPRGFTIHSGNAADLAQRKAEVEREKRAEAQLQRQKRAKAVLGDAAENAALAADSTKLDHKPVEDVADLLVRRYAKIVMFGGEAFMPVSLKEATECATAWANIGAKYDARRRLANMPDEVEDDPVKAAAAAVRQLKRNLASKSQAS